MSRRQANPTRRFTGSGSFQFNRLVHPKLRASPALSIVLTLLGTIFLVRYVYKDSGLSGKVKEAVGRVEGDHTCTLEVLRALPILREAYGDSMHKVFHVGPDTCLVVSELLKDEDTEAWGVEPYDLEDADVSCKSLVRRGFVRVANIKFPLPYRAKSFALAIVSDALDYLSPKYMNKTLPELARVSVGGLIIFTGYPLPSKVKGAGLTKFGRPAKMRNPSWWTRFFAEISLEKNEVASTKFEQAAAKASYSSRCQIFHLKSYH